MGTLPPPAMTWSDASVDFCKGTSVTLSGFHWTENLGALGIAVPSIVHMASESKYKPILNGKREESPQ